MKKSLALLFLAGLLTLSQNLLAAPPRGLLVESRQAPALRLNDMDGRVTDLRTLRGHWVLVHFWASWCGPCRQEMPSLQALDKKIPDSRLKLLLVNTAENQDEVFTFLSAVVPDLHTLLDPDGRVTDLWRPRGLPSSFLVDPQGRIRYVALGGRAWDTQPYLGFLQQLTR